MSDSPLLKNQLLILSTMIDEITIHHVIVVSSGRD
jgi:hypothetical protein